MISNESSLTQKNAVLAVTGDVIDQVAALAPQQATYALRRERAKVVASTQGSYDAMFAADVQGISVSERLLVALHASRLSGAASLASHYHQRLLDMGIEPAQIRAIEKSDGGNVADSRLQTILGFTATLIERPVEGDRKAVEALENAGLTVPAIVALGQLIAFLSYQIRVTAGLQAMAAMEAAS